MKNSLNTIKDELDVQNYREKRKETLIHLAEKKARDVIKYGKNILKALDEKENKG